MDAVIISPQEIGQDIKSNGKKNQKAGKGEGEDLFATLISNLLKEQNPDKSSNFLINKILDKSSNFEEQEHLISNFSKGSLENSHEIGHISIQELLEIAIRLKKGEELPNFPTDSKSLKIALSSPQAIQEFKNAKNIHDLLEIANKYEIRVKNFQFFKEEAPLLSEDKKILSKITSEDIFKLIDKKVPTKKLTQALIEQKPEQKKESSLLQDFLFGKSEDKKEKNSQRESSFSHESTKDVKKVDLVGQSTKNIQTNLTPKEQHETTKILNQPTQKIDTAEQPKNIQTNLAPKEQHETRKILNQPTQKMDTAEQPKNIQTNLAPKEQYESIKTLIQPTQKIDTTEQSKNIQTDLAPKEQHETTKILNQPTQKMDTAEQSKNIQTNLTPKEQHESIKTLIQPTQKMDTAEQPRNIQTNLTPKEQHESIKTLIQPTQKIDTTEQSKNIQTNLAPKEQHETTKILNQPTKKIDTVEQPKNIQTNLTPKEKKINREKDQKIGKTTPIQSNNNTIKEELIQKIQHSKIISKNIISEIETKQIMQPLQMKSNSTKTITIDEIQKKIDSSQESKMEEKTTLIHEIKSEKLEKQKTTPNIKRTFNSFAQDFKEQVENYKAPLMKIKMQLNPKNMGEVDVTLLNRGNNLHVNIQANQNTLALFLQNHTEFKNSLINMGFSGLQMNFGENSKDRQNEQNRKGNSKNNFNSEELETREIEDINLVIPKYI